MADKKPLVQYNGVISEIRDEDAVLISLDPVALAIIQQQEALMKDVLDELRKIKLHLSHMTDISEKGEF